MNQNLNETISRLKSCFPKGYMNYNSEFIADRQANRRYGNACCRLANCQTADDVLCAAIEDLSYDCCKSRPFSDPSANVDFRAYMIAGMNALLGKTYTEANYLTIHTHLGFGINRKMTAAFLSAGCDLKLLRVLKRERMISVDRLLATIAGLEYRARTLEQMRGGNDVLRRLLPKLISQQTALQVVHVVPCKKCRFFEPGDDTYGLCTKYLCTKHESGWCDSGKEKTKDAANLQSSLPD